MDWSLLCVSFTKLKAGQRLGFAKSPSQPFSDWLQQWLIVYNLQDIGLGLDQLVGHALIHQLNLLCLLDFFHRADGARQECRAHVVSLALLVAVESLIMRFFD